MNRRSLTSLDLLDRYHISFTCTSVELTVIEKVTKKRGTIIIIKFRIVIENEKHEYLYRLWEEAAHPFNLTRREKK